MAGLKQRRLAAHRQRELLRRVGSTGLYEDDDARPPSPAHASMHTMTSSSLPSLTTRSSSVSSLASVSSYGAPATPPSSPPPQPHLLSPPTSPLSGYVFSSSHDRAYRSSPSLCSQQSLQTLHEDLECDSFLDLD